MQPRPQSLAEVAGRSTDARSYEYELADFLHEFAFRGKLDMLTEQPPVLRERFALGAVYDAYLIDAVPERDDLGCLQMITSTAHFDEVRHLLDQTHFSLNPMIETGRCCFAMIAPS